MSGSFDLALFKTTLTRLAMTPGATLKEDSRATVVAELLEGAGLAANIDAAGNVWAALGPVAWSDAVIYDAHIDVVGRGVAEDLREESGRLIGAGVADNLTAAAMLILLAGRLKRREGALTRPLKFLFSVGEEGLGNLKGVRQAVEDHAQPPFLFVSWDLSYEKYSVTGLGSKRYRVAVNCPGGHSWADFGAPNAAEVLVDLLAAVRAAYRKHTQGLPSRTSYNLGNISGGDGINVIGRSAEAMLEFRGQDPAALAVLEKMLKERVASAVDRPEIKIALETIGDRPASGAAVGDAMVALALKTWERSGIAMKESQRSTNINGTLPAGWPSICLGLCRGGNIHREDEYVELESLAVGWRLLGDLTEALVF